MACLVEYVLSGILYLIGIHRSIVSLGYLSRHLPVLPPHPTSDHTPDPTIMAELREAGDKVSWLCSALTQNQGC